MDINKEIKKLESIYLEKPERVFTMYLNTDPADPDQQGGEWRIHLKNGLQQFEKYLKEDGNQAELDNFCKIKNKVKDFMAENELNLAKSVIIFATPDESIWFAELFQVPVTTELYWEEIAKVDQLLNLYHTYPKSGIILTQKEAVKIIETELGSTLDSYYYELDLDTESWKKHTGPHHAQATVSSGGKSVKREQFNKRFEANRHRWYKSIAAKLDKLAKDKNWEYIYMVGNQDETQDLAKEMNKPINTFIDKNMLDENEAKIIKTITEL
ncbi:VLRF1 family aeRF1-type release factor [Amphibacillus sp. Q70]|uniref:VLRF1 family aeRF1-type release factor n=1 Tax=Amphibacillus sp. Q70 TaxID=3453416 RepID=UPI003F8614FB